MLTSKRQKWSVAQSGNSTRRRFVEVRRMRSTANSTELLTSFKKHSSGIAVFNLQRGNIICRIDFNLVRAQPNTIISVAQPVIRSNITSDQISLQYHNQYLEQGLQTVVRRSINSNAAKHKEMLYELIECMVWIRKLFGSIL